MNQMLLVIGTVMLFAQSSFAFNLAQLEGSYSVNGPAGSTPLTVTIKQQSPDGEIGKLIIQQNLNQGPVICSGLSRLINTVDQRSPGKKGIITTLISSVLCDNFDSRTFKIEFKSTQIDNLNNFHATVTGALPSNESARMTMNFVRLLGSERR